MAGSKHIAKGVNLWNASDLTLLNGKDVKSHIEIVLCFLFSLTLKPPMALCIAKW